MKFIRDAWLHDDGSIQVSLVQRQRTGFLHHVFFLRSLNLETFSYLRWVVMRRIKRLCKQADQIDKLTGRVFSVCMKDCFIYFQKGIQKQQA